MVHSWFVCSAASGSSARCGPKACATQDRQRSLWRVHTPERFPPRRRSALSAGLFQDSSAAAAIPACHATANIFLAIGDRTRRRRGRKLGNDHEMKLRPRPHGSLSCEFESLTRDRAGACLASRAIDGGAIPVRTLPSENAPACIGMGVPSFFCNQRVHRRA